MSTDYEKFEKQMREQDAKLPKEGAHVPIGVKDEKGNLLILGGHKVNLWRLASGGYAIGNETAPDPRQAVKIYNQYNNTELQDDYVLEIFGRWYEKQTTIVARVPSRTDPSRTYTVRRNPSGELTCECQGWMFRGYCWHTEAVKELTNA